MKKFITSRPALQKMLQEVHPAERKWYHMAIQKYGSIQRTEEHRKWNYISKCKTCLKKHCLDVVLICIRYILAIPSLSLRLILECNDILPCIIFDVKNLCSRILIPKPQNFVCVRNVFIFLHSLCHQYLYRRRLF